MSEGVRERERERGFQGWTQSSGSQSHLGEGHAGLGLQRIEPVFGRPSRLEQLLHRDAAAKVRQLSVD